VNLWSGLIAYKFLDKKPGIHEYQQKPLSENIVLIGLQICDVAGLVALSFILQPIIIRSRISNLPLHPPYSQMCCYGLVIFLCHISI
jgi:hypothetical protein